MHERGLLTAWEPGVPLHRDHRWPSTTAMTLTLLLAVVLLHLLQQGMDSMALNPLPVVAMDLCTAFMNF